MTFKDFIRNFNSKDKATSNTKIQSVCKDIDIFLGDGPFESDIKILFLQPTKGTHWVAYINENFFDSYGCSSPQKRFVTERKGYCSYSEDKMQGLDSYCAASCLNIIYWTNVKR